MENTQFYKFCNPADPSVVGDFLALALKRLESIRERIKEIHPVYDFERILNRFKQIKAAYDKNGVFDVASDDFVKILTDVS